MGSVRKSNCACHEWLLNVNLGDLEDERHSSVTNRCPANSCLCCGDGCTEEEAGKEDQLNLIDWQNNLPVIQQLAIEQKQLFCLMAI